MTGDASVTSSPIVELVAKNQVLLAKVINDRQLALIHPSGDRRRRLAENGMGAKLAGASKPIIAKTRHDGIVADSMHLQFAEHTGTSELIISAMLSRDKVSGSFRQKGRVRRQRSVRTHHEVAQGYRRRRPASPKVPEMQKRSPNKSANVIIGEHHHRHRFGGTACEYSSLHRELVGE